MQLEDLSRHNCLHYSFFAGQSWRFLTPEGESVTTAVSGNLSASISSLLMEAAINHCGIAMLPEREADAAGEGRLAAAAVGQNLLQTLAEAGDGLASVHDRRLPGLLTKINACRFW